MIGVFGSGTGGIAVVGAIKNALPEYDLVYFGDTLRAPYDNNSLEAIRTFTREGLDLLIQKGAKLLVIASHAAVGALGADLMQQRETSCLEIVTPAVQQALRAGRHPKIGVIGTRATIASKIYEQKIGALNPLAKVFSSQGPLLVPLVEEGWLKKPETVRIVKKCVHPLRVRQIDTLILGCTRFVWLKEIIQRKMGPKVTIIDPTETVVGSIKTFLKRHPRVGARLGKAGQTHFLVSDVSAHSQKTAQAFFKGHVLLSRI